MKRIFISSVQKEFERERAAIKKMIEADPIIRAYYDAFVFEIDAPAADKSTQQVYLNEIEKSDVYLLLIGDKYGFEDADGVSPTEREYDRAVELGLPVVVLVCAPNPHIARALFWVKYIETVGTGLNDLFDSCADAGLKKPTIETNDLHFRLIIWRREDKPQIDENKIADKNTNDDEIIAFIVKNANLSVQDIANKMQIKLGVMRSAIARLKREKGLVHVGSRKTGHWEFRQKIFCFDSARGAGLDVEVAPTLTTKPSACVLRSINHP